MAEGNFDEITERLDEIMVPYLKSIQTAPPETTGA